MKTPILAADAGCYRAGKAITVSLARPAVRGFTLLELLVVMSIMMIAIGLVMPGLMSRDSNAFNAQVRQAVAVLNYARRVAIVEAQPRTARFHALDPDSADFDERKAALAASRVATQWVTEALELRFQSDRNRRDEQVEQLEVTFFPQGGSTGGILNFVQNNRSAKIHIDPLTGRIATAYNGEELDDDF